MIQEAIRGGSPTLHHDNGHLDIHHHDNGHLDIHHHDNSQFSGSESGKSEDSDGLKTYPCENCEKVFTDPSNLQRHIRSSHLGARCHACTDCGKTFATSSGLKQHQHIHSSVKPFQCEVCLKAYTQFSNLCRHKRMHADCRQQIKCKDCGQTFSTMTSLGKHKRFCEGVLRNGARFSIPALTGATSVGAGAEKMSPVLPSGGIGQQSAFPGGFMPFYGPRPPHFPFYPPFGASFPMFHPGHPIAAMASSPVLPEGKLHSSFSKMAERAHLEKQAKCNGSHDKRDLDYSDEAELSDFSIGSDLDTAGSDLESDSGSERRASLSKLYELGRSLPNGGIHPKGPPSKAHNHTHEPHVNGSSKHHALSMTSSSVEKERDREREREKAKVKKDPSEQPFDLSKSTKAQSGDQPLDLSRKTKQVVVMETTPRKTHIFGKKSPLPAATEPLERVHHAYPSPATSMANPMLSPMYPPGFDKNKMTAFQEAARMMAISPMVARFPFPAPAPFGPMGPMAGFMHRSPLDQAKGMVPFMKSPDSFPSYNPGINKVKDRYTCKFCGKIFPRSANLTRHLRTHTGEQPYKCKYCERSFSISSNLQRHVRNIHNKEKPFKCPICDRCFGQQTNLDRHLKKHESEGPNVIDSPPPSQVGHDLEEREESYFDEIRNFIGKTANPPSCPASPEKDYERIDANFSITAQIEKQNQMRFEKVSPTTASKEHPDLEHSDLDLGSLDDSDEVSPPKKIRLTNNNKDESTFGDSGVALPNSYHDDSEEEDVDEEEEEEFLRKPSQSSFELNTAAPISFCT